MSQPTPTPTETPPKAAGFSMVVWAGVLACSSLLGAAVPFVIPSGDSSASHTDAHGASGGSHGSSHGSAHGGESEGDSLFVPFDEVVVNLDDGRMTRYLRLSLTLQLASQEADFATQLETKRLLLKNWLLAHISDKSLEDIRGAVGQNRLRREIRDHFNSVLCPDGYDRISDVLFDEFNVQ